MGHLYKRLRRLAEEAAAHKRAAPETHVDSRRDETPPPSGGRDTKPKKEGDKPPQKAAG